MNLVLLNRSLAAFVVIAAAVFTIGAIGASILLIKMRKVKMQSDKLNIILNNIMSNVPHYIFWKTGSGVYEGCNANFAAVCGFSSPEEILGKTDDDLPWNEEERKFYRKIDLRVMQTGEPVVNVEEPLRDKNGKISVIVTSKYPLKDKNEKMPGVLGLSLDISDRKNLELQLYQAQKMDLFSQLAGGIAHDFNNVLGGILGNADILINQLPQKSPYRDFVNMIIDGSEKASALVVKLISISRKSDFVRSRINAAEVIEDVSKMTARLFKNEKIAFKTGLNTLKSIDDYYFSADGGSVQNMIISLVVNSIESMPEGGSVVLSTDKVYLDKPFLKTCVYETFPGEYIEIDVTDNGSGISPDDIKKIFEPFFTTKNRSTHFGLGLSTVYENMRNHGGTISVFSEEGKGTSVHLYFPAEAADSVVLTVKNDKIIFGQNCVLLIDDDDLIRKTAYEQLQYLGYTVLLADNGQRGINIYRTEKDRIAAVILDLIMPNQDGLEVFEKLKEISPDIKVLFTSGFGDDTVKIPQENSANTGFIKKPFRLAELSRSISELMG